MDEVNAVQPWITDNQNSWLEKDFTREEIEIALKSMNLSKAPSFDGAHAMFFQKHHNVVGDFVSKVCLDIFNNGVSAKPINKTHTVLILKVKSSSAIG